MSSNGSTEPTSLTIRILQEITDNFSEERALGQGAYGKVYRVRFLQGVLLFTAVNKCTKLLFTKRMPTMHSFRANLV
jgi:hypothetical protein